MPVYLLFFFITIGIIGFSSSKFLNTVFYGENKIAVLKKKDVNQDIRLNVLLDKAFIKGREALCLWKLSKDRRIEVDKISKRIDFLEKYLSTKAVFRPKVIAPVSILVIAIPAIFASALVTLGAQFGSLHVVLLVVYVLLILIAMTFLFIVQPKIVEESYDKMYYLLEVHDENAKDNMVMFGDEKDFSLFRKDYGTKELYLDLCELVYEKKDPNTILTLNALYDLSNSNCSKEKFKESQAKLAEVLFKQIKKLHGEKEESTKEHFARGDYIADTIVETALSLDKDLNS